MAVLPPSGHRSRDSKGRHGFSVEQCQRSTFECFAATWTARRPFKSSRFTLRGGKVFFHRKTARARLTPLLPPPFNVVLHCGRISAQPQTTASIIPLFSDGATDRNVWQALAARHPSWSEEAGAQLTLNPHHSIVSLPVEPEMKIVSSGMANAHSWSTFFPKAHYVPSTRTAAPSSNKKMFRNRALRGSAGCRDAVVGRAAADASWRSFQSLRAFSNLALATLLRPPLRVRSAAPVLAPSQFARWALGVDAHFPQIACAPLPRALLQMEALTY